MTRNASNIEAILFASGEPVPIARLSLVLSIVEDEVLAAAKELSDTLEKENHSLRILLLGDKIQLCTCPDYAPIISRVLEQRKPPSLTPSALETLAIVAYFQPVTAAYISKIRGVDSSYTIGTLSDKGLIRVTDRLDAPGRPSLYSTTDLFLRTMEISSLDELPPLPDMSSNEGIEKLQMQIDALQSASDNDTSKIIPAESEE